MRSRYREFESSALATSDSAWKATGEVLERERRERLQAMAEELADNVPSAYLRLRADKFADGEIWKIDNVAG